MPLCDTLLRCAEEPALFRVLWSGETLEEVRRTLEKFGYSRRQARRRLRAMESAFPEVTVHLSPRGFKSVPPLPDPNDRHVLAAALRKRAHAIITLNRRHFPRLVLAPLGIAVYSPDELLKFLLRNNRQRMLKILDAQAEAIEQSLSSVLQRLRPGLPEFVTEVEREPE